MVRVTTVPKFPRKVLTIELDYSGCPQATGLDVCLKFLTGYGYKFYETCVEKYSAYYLYETCNCNITTTFLIQAVAWLHNMKL